MKPWMKGLVILRLAGYIAIGGYFAFKSYSTSELPNNPQNSPILMPYPSLVVRNAPVNEMSLEITTNSLERRLK
jgi:hypothetical protein